MHFCLKLISYRNLQTKKKLTRLFITIKSLLLQKCEQQFCCHIHNLHLFTVLTTKTTFQVDCFKVSVLERCPFWGKFSCKEMTEKQKRLRPVVCLTDMPVKRESSLYSLFLMFVIIYEHLPDNTKQCKLTFLFWFRALFFFLFYLVLEKFCAAFWWRRGLDLEHGELHTQYLSWSL